MIHLPIVFLSLSKFTSQVKIIIDRKFVLKLAGNPVTIASLVWQEKKVALNHMMR